MPVYVDPTELRDSTRVPGPLQTIMRELPGLERATGADWLITPREEEIPPPGSPPGEFALRWHLSGGGVLVQRKSGMDLLNSIPILGEVIERMVGWGPSWLVVTGVLPCAGPGGKVVIGGQVTAWDWVDVEGALHAWQARGGCLWILPDDDALGPWVSRMLARCARWAEEPEKAVVHKPASQKVTCEEQNWVTTGLAFPPGIGPELRLHCVGSFSVEVCRAVCWACHICSCVCPR